MERHCFLCDKLLAGKAKRKSHILTKSSYFDKQIKVDGGHLLCVKDGKIITNDMGHFATEPLLCDECELMVGKWEEEREKLFSSKTRSSLDFINEPYIEVTGYNQDYIKLACLADLYRCSVATSEPYSGVNLDSVHSSAIKNMLHNGNAGSPEEYPVLLLRFDSKYKIIDEISNAPLIKWGPDGIRMYETIVPRGWAWVVKVDNRSCPALEKASIGSFNQTLKIINYGDARATKELQPIYNTIVGAQKI